MVMEAYCRLCVQDISSKHSVRWFKSENFQQALAGRVAVLLDVPVEANDGFSQVICERRRQVLWLVYHPIQKKVKRITTKRLDFGQISLVCEKEDDL